MNAKQIADIIARAPKQVERAMRDEIPRKAAIIPKNRLEEDKAARSRQPLQAADLRA